MRRKALEIALGFAVLAILAAVLYFVVVTFAGFLRSLEQPLIVAIIAASVTFLTSTITVVAGRLLERKREIEAHFRQTKYDQYDELLSILYSLFDSSESTGVSSDYVKRLREWQRKLILFAGPKTIQAFVKWMSNLKVGTPNLRTIILMEEFFKSLRADLGISNRGIQQGDFAHLVLRHGDLFVAMAKNNPEMTLTEFGEIEKTLFPDPPTDQNVTAASSAT